MIIDKCTYFKFQKSVIKNTLFEKFKNIIEN